MNSYIYERLYIRLFIYMNILMQVDASIFRCIRFIHERKFLGYNLLMTSWSFHSYSSKVESLGFVVINLKYIKTLRKWCLNIIMISNGYKSDY